jgi:hypothetical protein
LSRLIGVIENQAVKPIQFIFFVVEELPDLIALILKFALLEAIWI